MKKQTVMLLVSALLVLGAISTYAQSDSDFEVTLTSDGEGVIITKYIGKVAVVRIPATIQGMPVQVIGESAFSWNKTITSVAIPEGVTIIGKKAFSWCENLTSFNFPKNLITLDSAAFERTKITAVTIPNTLTNIGMGVFSECKSLKTVTISEGITAFHDDDKYYSILFYGYTALTTVTLPSTLKKIGCGDFTGCTALTAITLPASIEKIAEEAFSNCTALTTVTIPATVEKIEFVDSGRILGAFANCPKLSLATQAALKRVGVGYTGIGNRSPE
jgi:hypothetical protein